MQQIRILIPNIIIRKCEHILQSKKYNNYIL